MNEQAIRQPKKVYLELTRACNLACTHCLNSSGPRMEMAEELDSTKVLELIRRLADFGLLEIRFTGGEPTIHPVLAEAIALATKCGMKTSIGTNAVSITDEFASQLSQAGLLKAVVSVDGDEACHDLVRGAGSFKRTWRGIRALCASNVDVRVNAVAMKTTLAGLRSLGEMCARENVRLFIRRYIPSGRALGVLSEFPTKADYDKLSIELQDLVAQGVVDGHYLSNKHGVCSAGTSGFIILPDGRVKSCGFLSELGEDSYGNVRTQELSAIWSRVVTSRFLVESQATLQDWSNSHAELPRSNCPAIALGGNHGLVQIKRKTT